MLSNVTMDDFDLATPTSWKIVNAAYRLLWFKGPTEPEGEITETHSEIYKQIEPTKVNTWLHLAAILEQPVSIEHYVYVNFYSIKQVQSVYVQDLDEAYNAFVLLQQDHYDEELMDHLLDREGEILDTYQDTLFNFHYLPLLSGSTEQSIPEHAILIFSRINNG